MTTVAKKCVSCGTAWSSALPRCPFCGGEAAAEAPPKEVSLLAGLPPRPEEKTGDADDTPAALPKVEAPPPAPAAEPPAPADPPAVPAELPPLRLTEPVPMGPQVPSSTVPFVLGLLGIAACLALPLAVHFEEHRVIGVLAPLGAGVLAPFAPFAWLAGLRHEDHCRERNVLPSGLARAGRILGTIGTFVLIFNITMLAVISVVHKLSAVP